MKYGLLFIFSLNLLAANFSGNLPQISDLQQLQDSIAVQGIVEQVESFHQVKCHIRSATTIIGEQRLNFKCRSSENKIKLLIRVSKQDDKFKLKSYKLLFRK